MTLKFLTYPRYYFIWFIVKVKKTVDQFEKLLPLLFRRFLFYFYHWSKFQSHKQVFMESTCDIRNQRIKILGKITLNWKIIISKCLSFLLLRKYINATIDDETKLDRMRSFNITGTIYVFALLAFRYRTHLRKSMCPIEILLHNRTCFFDLLIIIKERKDIFNNSGTFFKLMDKVFSYLATNEYVA